MADVKALLSDAEHRMKQAVEAVRDDLGSVRTGRANPALVEGLMVDYHGVKMPLNQLSSTSAPEARLLLIQPWDRGALPALEKALLKADMGATPSSDGTVIRIALPPLTEERRKDLVRASRKRVEEGRVAVRNVRRDTNDRLRTLERGKELSQDESRRAQEALQKITDSVISQVDKVGEAKEAEVLEV
jgi:ribosome recycling factor